MGKIYSLDQIHRAPEFIPRAEDFEAAARNFTDTSREAIEAGVLSGAVIYGSVAGGTQTIRSDFDCMVIPYDHSDASLAVVNSIVRATRGDAPIEINAIKHHKRRLESGSHEIDEYFGEHLTGPFRTVLGEDLGTYIRFSGYGTYEELLRYIQHKKRSVTLGDDSSNTETLKAMQRTLELPLAIGRKALMVLQRENHFPSLTFNSGDKSHTAQLAIAMFDSFGLADVPHRLVTMDRDYTHVLTQTLVGNTTDAEYQESLDEIKESIPAASRWLDDIDDAITDVYVRSDV